MSKFRMLSMTTLVAFVVFVVATFTLRWAQTELAGSLETQARLAWRSASIRTAVDEAEASLREINQRIADAERTKASFEAQMAESQGGEREIKQRGVGQYRDIATAARRERDAELERVARLRADPENRLFDEHAERMNRLRTITSFAPDLLSLLLVFIGFGVGASCGRIRAWHDNVDLDQAAMIGGIAAVISVLVLDADVLTHFHIASNIMIRENINEGKLTEAVLSVVGVAALMGFFAGELFRFLIPGKPDGGGTAGVA